MNIHNCHTHIFTVRNVPKDFLPLKLSTILRWRPFRWLIGGILKNVLPFTDKDMLDRYVRFVEISYKKDQKAIFEHIRGFYPKGTKFVVLAMDMAYMGAGSIEQSLVDQHRALAEVAQAYPDQVLPFVAVDPRRPDLLDMTVDLIENHGYRGIKLYPPLGYFPFDSTLRPVYEYAQANGIPVMTHCSRGGVYFKGKITDDMLTHPKTGEKLKKKSNKEFTDVYADPANYKYVLDEFPNLKLCLAHFGGGSDWDDYLDQARNGSSSSNWLVTIMDMIKSGQYPNLYTDISSTLHEERFVPLLKVLLQDPALRNQIIFGTDYYMVSREITERDFSIQLRAGLGEANYQQIAETNAIRYLDI